MQNLKLAAGIKLFGLLMVRLKSPAASEPNVRFYWKAKMISKINRTPVWYFYFFIVFIFIVAIVFILFVQKHNYERQYQSPLLSDNGNLKISIINNNDKINTCDIQIFIDNIKLVHSNFFYDESGHNDSIYKFEIDPGKYLFKIWSDSLNISLKDSISLSDLLWVTISIKDSIVVEYSDEEILFL